MAAWPRRRRTKGSASGLHVGVARPDEVVGTDLEALHFLRHARELLELPEKDPHGLVVEECDVLATPLAIDAPIVVCRIDEIEDLQIVRQLLKAHAYWRMKQLAVDLVIVNERSTSYIQDLQSALESVVRVNLSRSPSENDGAQGRVFLLRKGSRQRFVIRLA